MNRPNVLNAKDKLTVKVFVGYEDGSCEVHYLRPKDVHEKVEEFYCVSSTVYIYTHERPFSRNNRVVYSDKIETMVREMEVHAERYIKELQSNQVKQLTNELKEAKQAFDLILLFRKWSQWEPKDSLSVIDYYRRGEWE